MPPWLDKCVEKYKDVKEIDNEYAFCQWLKKQDRLETNEDIEKLVKDYTAKIETIQQECDCDGIEVGVVHARLSQYGHSNPKKGTTRVVSALDACKISAKQSALKAGLNEKEAEKLAKDECETQGERMGEIL
jgi:hypothetical protein